MEGAGDGAALQEDWAEINRRGTLVMESGFATRSPEMCTPHPALSVERDEHPF